MTRRRLTFHSTFSCSARAASLAGLLSACQARAPRPDPSADIARAVGLDQVIELRIEALDDAEPPPALLELAHALRRALHSSPELMAALARVQVALADADQARLLVNPVLSLVLRFPEGGGSTQLEAGVGQELLQFFHRPRRIGAADKRLQTAVAQAVATGLDVVAELRGRYATVQALDELTPLLRERQQTLDRLTELARARLQAGEASRLDVLALEAEAAELEIELGQRELERTEERLSLARLIGQPSLASDWQLEGWSALPAALPAESVWVRAALEHRPEIVALGWELEALGDEGALAGSAWLAQAEAGLEAERDEGWSLGPSAALPLPLFDDGSARRERALGAVLEARAELLGARRTAVEEVRRAHASLRASQAVLERVRTRLIPLQRERRAQVEAVYLAGEADVTAVLLAEQDLQATQAKLVELQHVATQALIDLERAVGGAGVAPTISPTDPAEHEEEEAPRP